MKKKSMMTLLLTVSLTAAVGVGTTLAYFTDKDEQSNVVTMGHVDISLTERSEDENAEAETEGIVYREVVPGAVLSKIPEITLEETSRDAYIRTAVTIKFVDENQNEIGIWKNGRDVTADYKEALLAACNFAPDKWTKGEDGYFYYSEKLTQENKSAELFTTVTVPAAWGNETADTQFVIELTAEAIQADNFTPGEAGWFNEAGEAVTVETYGAQ